MFYGALFLPFYLRGGVDEGDLTIRTTLDIIIIHGFGYLLCGHLEKKGNKNTRVVHKSTLADRYLADQLLLADQSQSHQPLKNWFESQILIDQVAR